MMILYAASKLKQNTSETSAVSFKTSEIQPTTKTQQTNAQSVSFSPEAQQLYQQLADQYTQIVDNGCFGTLTQIAEKMDCCKHFLEQWMEALCNKDFVALLQNKAKYDEYLKGFRLPQFGTWRTIQAEGGDDSIPDGLTKALVGRIQRKQKMLQEFWEAQKWFEELIPSLQTCELTVNPDAEPLSKKLDYEYPNTNNITSRTPLAKFNDFYAIDLETTGLSAARNEIIQIAIIKFRHFQPVEILTSYVKPRKGLKPETAAINHITEDMVADAPYIEQIMQSVDTFIGEKAPIVAHNLQFEYKFLEANGCENIYSQEQKYRIKAIHVSVFPLKSTSAILLFIEDGVKRYRKFYRSLRKLPNDDQLAAINYLVFSYTENVFMNPTTHKELRKNDLFMDMCRKSTDFRSHTPFPLDDPLEAAVKEFSLSKRNEIPNLLSREYALN